MYIVWINVNILKFPSKESENSFFLKEKGWKVKKVGKLTQEPEEKLWGKKEPV